jgi:hypothetical protein
MMTDLDHLDERFNMIYDVLNEIRHQVTELRVAHDRHFANWNKRNGFE